MKLIFALTLTLIATGAYAQAGSNATAGNIACDKSISFNTNTSGDLLLVAAITGRPIYICGFGFFAGGTTAANFIYATKMTDDCDTGATNITPPMPFVAQTGFSFPGYVYAGLNAPAGKQLCLDVGSSAQITGFVLYAQ